MHPNTSSRCIALGVPSQFFPFNRFRFCIHVPPVQCASPLPNSYVPCTITEFVLQQIIFTLHAFCCTQGAYLSMAKLFSWVKNLLKRNTRICICVFVKRVFVKRLPDSPVFVFLPQEERFCWEFPDSPCWNWQSPIDVRVVRVRRV